MPAILIWVGFLLLPGALVLGLLWYLLRHPIRWTWNLFVSLLPWRTDDFAQRVLCDGCSHEIRSGRGPAAYAKCPRCKVSAGALRAA
jgi:hypothetical protein